MAKRDSSLTSFKIFTRVATLLTWCDQMYEIYVNALVEVLNF